MYSSPKPGFVKGLREEEARQLPALIFEYLDFLRPTDIDDEDPPRAPAQPRPDLPSPQGPSGYLVSSTAPENVEDYLPASLARSWQKATGREGEIDGQNASILKEIADKLSGTNAHEREILIAVHGFSTDAPSAIGWYQQIYDYARCHPLLKSRETIFIGYRWPSEKTVFSLERIKFAWQALPNLPKGIFLLGLTVGIAALSLLLSRSILGAFTRVSSHLEQWIPGLVAGVPWAHVLATVLGALTGFLAIVLPLLAAFVLALVLQRLVVYFRDVFRANYFATPDLVELVQLLSAELESRGIEGVKLSFLAHSLGCGVTTNAIRIMVDAFPSQDPAARKSISQISSSLSLGRLLLVAPDIPIESVIPRRSNVLVSSVERISECHVFTNEGDLALRLASTAANFFSFPARSIYSGYRLGNLTARHFANEHDRHGIFQRISYGIIPPMDGSDLPASKLELRASNAEHRNLAEPPFGPWFDRSETGLTNRMSYYDCTDYIDRLAPHEPSRGLLTAARSLRAINILGYASLLKAYICGEVDTHGGYFKGPACKELIYVLAFVGFDALVLDLSRSHSDLSQVAKRHQLQLILSPRERRRLQTLMDIQEGSSSGLDKAVLKMEKIRDEQGKEWLIIGDVMMPIRAD
ncbi:MAG: hypothetical protein RLZZ609_1026 [Cyanobacteriota bacterium]|jgi:hypothetical protein